ncbi:IS3-Spn1 transposase, truncation [Streptococcus pneumoniae]|uniref:IS3 family transposase n=1 Tax=Streptococcus pneumoniae TaxID=1313 RepID=UPI000B73FA52|nr:IS3 family transposase [Streptococcus pneumoniae]SNF03171.1 IS3-Spn1 transposase, truncation [Streptococcus pneumoniae]
MEKRNKARAIEPSVTELDKLPYTTAFYIGLFQVLALLPGTSRSGATIVGGLLNGTSRSVVTEFAIPASTQKLYLSPVLDGFNSEIIAYNLSTSPNLEQVQTMLEQAFTEKHYENTILHSDQGWQYQHDSYHQFLEGKGIQASMSRKGNSQDNGMMESFFGILKSEMFYGYEKTFKSLNQLEQAIVDYIDYYNNKRIKVKLKGLSPVQYRTKSFG